MSLTHPRKSNFSSSFIHIVYTEFLFNKNLVKIARIEFIRHLKTLSHPLHLAIFIFLSFLTLKVLHSNSKGEIFLKFWTTWLSSLLAFKCLSLLSIGLEKTDRFRMTSEIRPLWDTWDAWWLTHCVQVMTRYCPPPARLAPPTRREAWTAHAQWRATWSTARARGLTRGRWSTWSTWRSRGPEVTCRWAVL